MKATQLSPVQADAFRAERRNFQRVKVNIYGRFMLEDHSEHPCQVVDMSPGSAAFRTDTVGELGERVIAYIDHIGRVEGVITRHLPDGFALTLIATERKKDKLAAKLTWLANRHELNLPEDRRHDRVVPSNPVTTISLPDGRQYRSRILDMSLSGAAIAVEAKPPIGSPIWIGKLRATVVRHFDEGIALEFAVQQTRESLEEGLD